MDKIKRLSIGLKYIFYCILFLIPILEIWAWVIFNGTGQTWLSPSALDFSAGDPRFMQIDNFGKVLGILASTPLVLAEMYGIRQLAILFNFYSKGIIFKKQNIRCYKHAAWAFIICELISPISQAGASIAATLNNGVGNRIIQIGFNESDLGHLLVGVTILVISWVMEEGNKLQAEAELTI